MAIGGISVTVGWLWVHLFWIFMRRDSYQKLALFKPFTYLLTYLVLYRLCSIAAYMS